jgi:hypothetical protein
MPDDDVAVFQALAGELLDRLGYPQKNVAPGASSDAIIEKSRKWWDDRDGRPEFRYRKSKPCEVPNVT